MAVVVYWRDNSLEYYSSRGPTTDGRLKPELVAPARVTSFQGSFAGTSAATPHVAGAAALVWSRYPQMSANDVRAYWQSNAVDMGVPGPDMETGFGRLQLPAPGAPAVVAPTAAPTFFATATVAPTALPSATPTAQPSATMILPTATFITTNVAIVPSPSVPASALIQPAIPRPPESQRSDTMTLIASLGLLMCGGVSSVVGGLTTLVIVNSKSRAAMPAAPPPPSPPRVASYPVAPRLPIAPRSGALTLVGARGQRVVVLPGDSIVGRAPNSAIYFDHPQVSRQHARISWDGTCVTLTDLGSTNGTLINGRRMTPNVPAPLQSGDRISFGGAAAWLVMIG